MWITKFKFSSKSMLFGDNLIKSGCNVLGYPISYYKKESKLAVIVAIQVLGTDKQIKYFLSLLKKDKRTINIERNKDFIISEVFQHPSGEIFFQKGIIFVNPIIVNNKGDYIFELGCFKRESLIKIIKIIKSKLFDGELNYIKKSKLKNVSLMTVMPNLTKKQKLALELAIKHNYYDYPRKIELKKLAKLMNISYSTYHFHLRKAEKKIMSFSFDKVR